MVRLLASGDTALVVEFGAKIDRALNDKVIALSDRIRNAAIPGVVELVPTFRSLMVHYDPCTLLFAELQAHIEGLLADLPPRRKTTRRWRLPVCYGGEHGPDLGGVAARLGLPVDAVIDAHAATAFHIYCIGFLPGYPYMGDLDERFALPRRETPRVRVPMGAVCIAQRMTGVYPLDSPGGWHLIGRTPVRMFDVRRPRPVLLSPGDEVHFTPVSDAEFTRLEAEAAAGTLVAEPELLAA